MVLGAFVAVQVFRTCVRTWPVAALRQREIWPGERDRGGPENPEDAPLLAGLFLSSTFFASSLGRAPFPLFQSVIYAPVCGSAYSRPARLFLPDRRTDPIVELHLGFS